MSSASSPAPEGIPTFAAHVRALAERLVTADNPYEVGLQIWGDSFRASELGELAWQLGMLWGALTDWVECKPDEERLAMEEMRRAAREWLTVDYDDEATVDGYFDHWLYEVCGYERP